MCPLSLELILDDFVIPEHMDGISLSSVSLGKSEIQDSWYHVKENNFMICSWQVWYDQLGFCLPWVDPVQCGETHFSIKSTSLTEPLDVTPWVPMDHYCMSCCHLAWHMHWIILNGCIITLDEVDILNMLLIFDMNYKKPVILFRWD